MAKHTSGGSNGLRRYDLAKGFGGPFGCTAAESQPTWQHINESFEGAPIIGYIL